MRKDIFFLVFGCFLFGCEYQGYWNGYLSITDYEINPNITTPSGIQVDTSGFEINLEEIDRQVDSLERCLQNVFEDPEFLDEVLERGCWNFEYDPDFVIRRDWFIVKIAPDWFVSECSGQQVFPCDIDPRVCEDKGLEITENCPCMCRSTIQNENVVVTTPNLYLFRAELARMVTGCNNPWFYPVSRCLLDR